MTEDEMVGWHHQLNDYEFEQPPEGQRSLACCSPWGCKESDTTQQLNNNKMKIFLKNHEEMKGEWQKYERSEVQTILRKSNRYAQFQNRMLVKDILKQWLRIFQVTNPKIQEHSKPRVGVQNTHLGMSRYNCRKSKSSLLGLMVRRKKKTKKLTF